MSRRFGLGVIAVLGLGLIVWFLGLAMVGPPRGATATDLLGIDLPASTGEERLAIQRHGFGEYRAYIRFADPAFQPQQQAGDPFAVFRNAAIGDRPLAAEVIASPRADARRRPGATLSYPPSPRHPSAGSGRPAGRGRISRNHPCVLPSCWASHERDLPRACWEAWVRGADVADGELEEPRRTHDDH